MNIREYLGELARQGEVRYCPNPGNAGDSLIAMATFQLLGETGVRYRFLDERTLVPETTTLLYAGGGNLIHERSYSSAIIRRYHARVRRLVVLPHTVRGNEDLLAELGPNVEIITREETSFRHVARNVRGAGVLLMDDLAFSLDVGRLLGEPSPVLGPLMRGELTRKSFRRFLQGSLRARAVRPARTPGPGRTLNVFRRDGEATDVPLPPRNYDLPRIFEYGTYNPAVCRLGAVALLRALSRFDLIRTNRLHVSVAGALLGKSVELYPNNYDKNEAVYRFSMEGRLPNVRWMGR